MSLRFRLTLLITVLLLLFLMAVESIIVREARTSIKEGVEAANRVTIQLLDTVIVSSYRNPELGLTHVVLRDFLQSLGRVRSINIVLYDATGTLIYSSPPTKFREEDEPPQWFKKLVAPKTETVVRRIRFGTLVVTSSPVGAMRESWAGVRGLLLLWLGFFVVLNALVYWVLGRALRPVRSILGAIERMERGDMGSRLPAFSQPEFSQIGQSFNRMAQTLESSTEENRRLALIVRQSGDAIMIHDLDGNISFWNPAAERLFGFPAQEIIGKSAAMLAPAGRENELAQNLAAIAARRQIENYDTQRVTRDGLLIDVSLSAAPLVDPREGTVIGEICSMRDITERKLVQEAERQLEENRLLTQIIQRHIEEERRSLARELHDELGQYVTAIKSFAFAIGGMAKDKLPEVEAGAQTIVAAANHIYDGMHNIIRQLRPGALDNLGLAETLRDSVATWQVQCPNTRLGLRFSGKLDRLGEPLNINLYRIVQESVTNALRHSNATKIDIAISRRKDNSVHLKIRDDGIGMNYCDVDQTRHFGLLGIRERVQALNGTFSVDSLPGNGVCITVDIPLGGGAV